MTSSDGDRVRDASVGSGITRYWCPRDASVPLDEGYLADLDAFGMRSPALRTIDQLADLQVVVLLGEGGLARPRR